VSDPDGRGYAGKELEEIQQLLTSELHVYGDREIPEPPDPNDPFVDLPSWFPLMSALSRGVPLAAVQAEIATQRAAYEESKPKVEPRFERVVLETKPARVFAIWDGIPYCRNVPSLDNIAEALEVKR
jgi:hypothetical protein